MDSPDRFENPFRRLLAGAKVPLGTWLMSGASSTAEAMGHAGFDWLVVDMEHVPIDVGQALHILQAIAGTPAVPVTRIPWNDGVLAKRALDIGAQTLMFPYVCSAEEAARAVASTRYAPAGTRGFAAMHRASGYGTKAGYVQRANDGICCIVQIETLGAVEALEAICAVPGVDAIFVGPGDLSASMGIPGEFDHEKLQAVLAAIAKRCQHNGTPCGILATTPEMAQRCVAMGYHYVAVASDMGMLMRQAKATIEAVTPALRKR